MKSTRAFPAMFLIVVCGVPAFGQVTITAPSALRAVNEGGTVQFLADQLVTWSMVPGSQGTITLNGLYTAPASVIPQQSYGSCQVLPNNHIYNTRIDSLPINANSSSWMAVASSGSVNYYPSFPLNHLNSSTPTKDVVFYYTPANNGSFEIPAYPGARIESGWFVPPLGDLDRHLLGIDTNTCGFQEMYDLYSAGTNSDCPTCTSESGVKYSNSYDLAVNGGTDAASLYIMPLSLHLQELEQAVATGGTIKHALRVTMPAGWVGDSFSSFIWPAQASSPGGGSIPYGARFRLQSSFNISSYSAIAQVLMTQLQQYGMILADIGSQWEIDIDYEKWPQAYLDAFNEVAGAVTPANLEAVDESGLMAADAGSGMTNVNAETVIATSVANPSQSAQLQVILTGVTIDVSAPQLYFEAGASPYQLIACVHGATNTNVTWSMNPMVGILTSSGSYTPPASVSSATVTSITATSAADPNATALMTLTVLPVDSSGTMRIILGETNPYTDSDGNVWQATTGDDGGSFFDNGGAWPSVPDIFLYQVAHFAPNDQRFDLIVPNGTYRITGKFAETEDQPAGSRLMDLEAQGQIVFPNVDLAAAAGDNEPVDYTLPATVTDGHLSFVLRRVAGDFTEISALEVTRTSNISGQPAPPSNLQVNAVQ